MAQDATKEFRIGLARAAGGSILFSLPMLMTMEMWQLGFHMDPLRLALMLVLSLPMIAGLAYYSGFQKRISVRGATVDAFVAFAVGAVTSTVVLALLAVISPSMTVLEVTGKIAIQTIPASIGAVFASSEMGSNEDRDDGDEIGGEPRGGYWRELFLMIAGALFLAFNLAPTDEMVVIANAMTAWHGILLVLVSLAIMHAFVYKAGFRGQETHPESHSWWAVFSRFTLTGYALALCVSLFCLWSFGRMDGNDPVVIVSQAVVLGFPAAIGAAAARLIL